MHIGRSRMLADSHTHPPPVNPTLTRSILAPLQHKMEAVERLVSFRTATHKAVHKAVHDAEQELMDSLLKGVLSENGSLTPGALISEEWLRLKRCPKELKAKANDLAKVLLERLHEHGIYYLAQLQALSMHGQLADVLGCVGVSMQITETFDRLTARNRRKHKVISFLMSLSGNLASMEAMCVNYGLAAALVLTMTFANFGSITHEDWMEYRRNIALHDPKCQALGETNCAPEGIQRSDNIMLDYSRPAFCLTALNTLIEDPAANLTGTDEECCIEVVKCIADKQFDVELCFGFGNGGGTAILLLVVLFTSWLFISLNATKANINRYAEASVLRDRLRQEFLVLQFLFSIGMIFAFAGMGSVMVLKSETYGISWMLYIIFIAALLCSIGFALKTLWEVFHINREIDIMRSDATDSFDEVVAAADKNKKNNSSPESPRRSKAEGERKAGEAMMQAKEAQLPSADASRASGQATGAKAPSQVTIELERAKPLERRMF